MDVWTALTALVPSVTEAQWRSVVDVAASDELVEEALAGYHDRARDLEAFAVATRAPEERRTKQGTADDVELQLLTHVAKVLATAASYGVYLSAPGVIALVRTTES
jgi:hypothetical protein